MASLDISEVAGHVNDGNAFHFPFHLSGELPAWMTHLKITRYVLIEMIAATIIFVMCVTLARKIRGGKTVKGRFWNALEAILVYIRDEVIRPSIGEGADRFVPYLWTVFFFVLSCNLAGMLPWSGSPTGAISVTAVLALCTLTVVLTSGMRHHGVVGYWTGLLPPMELNPVIGLILKPLLFGIEFFGLFVKHGVLAIRLMANMFAGHLTLAVILAFIPMAFGTLYIWIPVTCGCVAMNIALSCLELFIAFLQAYIFTFLSALFIGMSIHQH